MKEDDRRVYLGRVEIDRPEAPFDAYRELAYRSLLRLELSLPTEGTIFLKPNATVLYPPEKRIITHPGFLAGILDALVEKGMPPERLAVGDGQSGEHPDRDHTWERAGYRGMLAARGVRLAPLNGTESRPVTVPGGVVFGEYPVYREVADCSFFINVPLAKCHNLGCTTLSVKNLMGVLAMPERHLCNLQEVDRPFEEGIWRLTENGLSLFEERFCHKLCDLVSAVRSLGIPRLCVVDGLVGRDGTAFNEGDNHPLGWTLIGENEVNVDAMGTYLMGLDPGATPYLKVAAERGLGANRVEEIEVIDLVSGERLEGAALKSFRSERRLMPIARHEGGYYDRFRANGSVVPWRIDDVNRQRQKDGLPAIPVA